MRGGRVGPVYANCQIIPVIARNITSRQIVGTMGGTVWDGLRRDACTKANATALLKATVSSNLLTQIADLVTDSADFARLPKWRSIMGYPTTPITT